MKQALLLITLILTVVVIGCTNSGPYANQGTYVDPSANANWGMQRNADLDARNGDQTPARNRASRIPFLAQPDQTGELGDPSPPGFLAIAPGEEVWIIATPPRDTVDEQGGISDETYPGGGGILALSPPTSEGGKPELVPIPLEHTEVSARVDTYLATVDVTQQFHNPFDSKIEAVYVFPLPQDAAISEFVMILGERKIRGILREKKEAERIYAAAKAQGHNASLLTQQRPNIFTQKVANIEPGQRIDVQLRYFQTLAYADGIYSFVFPMVVGPRFNPQAQTDGIGAVGYGKARTSGQATEAQYLRPNQRSGHDIGLSLTLAPGVPIEEFRSHNHEVNETANEDGSVTYRLAKQQEIPNRDFVLSYRVAGNAIRANVLTHRDPKTGEGYFTMTLLPPSELGSLSRQPMEMVFVVDCSGSMNGAPLNQAKAAVLAALDQLQPADSFQIIRFSSDASQLGQRPLAATQDNLDKARGYVRGLSGTGGTQMIEGIKAALDFPQDPGRYRVVTFLTDGFIGNDRQIIGEVNRRLGQARIFSFGVGSSPNRYLLHRLAKQGRGTAAFLGLNDDAAAVMQAYFDRVSHPAMTDVSLAFAGVTEVSDVYPSQLPDLFVGRPVVVTGRFAGELNKIQVVGEAGGEKITATIEAPQTNDTHPALAKVWARQRIADLADRMTWADGLQRERLAESVLGTALRHGLISDYTAFVAVDASRITEGDHGYSVVVPVPVPEGVRYETTVIEN